MILTTIVTYAQMTRFSGLIPLQEMAVESMFQPLIFVKTVRYFPRVRQANNTKKKFIAIYGQPI